MTNKKNLKLGGFSSPKIEPPDRASRYNGSQTRNALACKQGIRSGFLTSRSTSVG
ncbi:hypothetical protein IQ255_21010 [Pleurocapsales cyanobacterium LEGE 10410]|nr:hypothetical protein [Pleurocapsales cyanobacterium LEGE 10410]